MHMPHARANVWLCLPSTLDRGDDLVLGEPLSQVHDVQNDTLDADAINRKLVLLGVNHLKSQQASLSTIARHAHTTHTTPTRA
jgi:hypothetical protein